MFINKLDFAMLVARIKFPILPERSIKCYYRVLFNRFYRHYKKACSIIRTAAAAVAQNNVPFPATTIFCLVANRDSFICYLLVDYGL